MLWLHCCSDPKRCSVFLISQTGTFCRCEFLSDSGGDKHSELVIAVPWVGVCLLWNIQMSLFFFSTPPPPHRLFLCHPPPPIFLSLCLTRSQLSKLPLFTFFNLFPSISHCHFLSLFLSFFSAILSLSLCLFDVSAALTQTRSRLNSPWMLMEFLDCGMHAHICVRENLLLLVSRDVFCFSA